MTHKKESDKKCLSDDEVEKILDSLWENWSSRRKCEKTHKPKYINKKRL